jgi:hypothetical protein
MAVIAAKKMRSGRLADAQRRWRGHGLAVGEAPDSVRAEEFARHARLIALIWPAAKAA